MRCPVCGIEMRVEHRSAQALAFACRNRQCPRYEQIVAEKRLD